MPPLPAPSPTTSGRPPSTQRLPNAARAQTAASQARAGTPKSQQNSNGIQPKSTRIRGGTDKDSIGSLSTKYGARRGSTAHLAAREKPPSKDGTVQRTAKDVEGLKDFVGHHLSCLPGLLQLREVLRDLTYVQWMSTLFVREQMKANFRDMYLRQSDVCVQLPISNV